MIEGVIFDLDGTLVKTEELKARSYAEAAVELRPDLEAAEVLQAFSQVVGRSRREVATTLLEAFDLSGPARERMEEFGVGVVAVATPFTLDGLQALDGLPPERLVRDPASLAAVVEMIMKEAG